MKFYLDGGEPIFGSVPGTLFSKKTSSSFPQNHCTANSLGVGGGTNEENPFPFNHTNKPKWKVSRD